MTDTDKKNQSLRNLAALLSQSEEQISVLNLRNQQLQAQHRLDRQQLALQVQSLIKELGEARQQVYDEALMRNRVQVQLNKLLEQNSVLVSQNSRLTVLLQRSGLSEIEAQSLRQKLQLQSQFMQELKNQLLSNKNVYESKLQRLRQIEQTLESEAQLIKTDRKALQVDKKEYQLQKTLLNNQNQFVKKQLLKQRSAHKNYSPYTPTQRHSLSPTPVRAILTKPITPQRTSPIHLTNQRQDVQEMRFWLEKISDQPLKLGEAARRGVKLIRSVCDMLEKVLGRERYEQMRWSKRLHTTWQDLKQLVRKSI